MRLAGAVVCAQVLLQDVCQAGHASRDPTCSHEIRELHRMCAFLEMLLLCQNISSVPGAGCLPDRHIGCDIACRANLLLGAVLLI